MWESEKRGYLMVGNKALHIEQIVRLVGAGNPESEVLYWLSELKDAGVYSETDEGVMYSRRMVDDEGDTKTSKVKNKGTVTIKTPSRTRARPEDEDEHTNKKYRTKRSIEDALHAERISYDHYPSFKNFWEIYPPRNGVRQNKKEAFITWVFQSLEEKGKIIIDSVVKLKDTESWTKENGRFVPMATTFLNGDRWEDEVEDFTPSAWGLNA
jgi:hypothetical protein